MKMIEIKSQFLRELSTNEFLVALKAHARNSHAIVKQSPLFCRTVGSEIALVNPIAKKNSSAFWVDSLIREIPGWKKYPSRESFIRGYTTAEAAGVDACALIPLDGSVLGIAPENSFYRSFVDFQRSLKVDKVDNSTLIDWILRTHSGIMKLLGASETLTAPTSLSQFYKQVDKIDKILAESKNLIKLKFKKNEIDLNDQEALYVGDLLSRHVISTNQYLREKLDPEQNGFKLLKVESIYNFHDDQEVWTSSPCLVIKREKYIELFKNGELS